MIQSDFECVIDPITKEHTFVGVVFILIVKMKNIVKTFKHFIIYKNIQKLCIMN